MKFVLHKAYLKKLLHHEDITTSLLEPNIRVKLSTEMSSENLQTEAIRLTVLKGPSPKPFHLKDTQPWLDVVYKALKKISSITKE